MSTAIFADEYDVPQQREAWLLRLAFVFVLLAALALIVARWVRFAQTEEVVARLPVLSVPLVWAAAAWLAHRVLNRVLPARDPCLLPTTMLLTGWGLLVVWRVSPAFGARQTAWFVISLAVLVEILRGPSDLAWLRRYRSLWLVGGLALLALTLVFGTHPSGGEPRLWLGCCGLYVQPSEPLRLLLIAYLSAYLAERRTHNGLRLRRRWLLDMAPLLVMWGLSIALLLVQRDLGTGTLLVALLAAMLFVATGRWQILVAAFVLALLGGGVGYAVVDVVHERIESWLDPWQDPIGSSYQIVQSLIAIASGGIVGRGPGMGSPGLVPVVHTDLIYAAIAEEWGLVGALGMIACLAVVVGRGLRAAMRARDLFAALLATGISLSVGLQAVLIIGGAIRLVPLTGVTLPFVSYGGSSLVTSYASMAFLLLVSNERGRPGPLSTPLRLAGGGMLLAWLALALGTGWWSIYRAPVLTARTDNARRGIAERISPRGDIVDRSGRPLAVTTGSRGSYRRTYAAPSAYSLVGYNSMAYAQAGVEASMDAVLRGEMGYDAWTLWWSNLVVGAPPPGLDVRLTIDLDLQEVAAKALDSHRGAIVLVDPLSGDILALVSSPTHDPNRLDEDWPDLVSRDDAPLLNRATQGVFQPGPALGPFVLAWAERQGLVRPSDAVADAIVPLPVNGALATCAQSPDLAVEMNYGLAVQQGCPAVLASLGTRLGKAEFLAMVSAFGLDRVPALEIESVSVGSWSPPEQPRDLALAAAGQGGLRLTPLQLVRAFSSLAAGGNLPRLRLVDAIRGPDGEWHPIAVSGEQIAALPGDIARDVMRSLRIAGSRVSGVTAQALGGPEGKSVSWFLGATVDGANPRVLVVVLEEAAAAEARRIGFRLLERSDTFP